MTEILASKSPVLIQLVAMFFIAWEISGFSDKNIYRDYNKIRIKIVIGEQYLYDTKKTYSSFCRLKSFKTPLYTGVFKAQGILRFEN